MVTASLPAMLCDGGNCTQRVLPNPAAARQLKAPGAAFAMLPASASSGNAARGQAAVAELTGRTAGAPRLHGPPAAAPEVKGSFVGSGHLAVFMGVVVYGAARRRRGSKGASGAVAPAPTGAIGGAMAAASSAFRHRVFVRDPRKQQMQSSTSTSSGDSGPLSLVTSASIGICTGFGVLAFEMLIHSLEHLREAIPFPLVAPIGGALLLGLIFTLRGDDGLKGTDLKSLKSYDGAGGAKPPEDAPLRAAMNATCAAISLGFGNSLGPEAPAATLGANVAFNIYQVVRPSDDVDEGKVKVDVESGPAVPCEMTSALISQALAGSQVVANLEDSEIERLKRSFKQVKVAAGEPLIKQGDEVGDKDPGLFIVETGNLDVYVQGQGETGSGFGKKVFSYTERGMVIGELAVLYRDPRAATVLAQTDSVLWSVDRASFVAAGGRAEGAMKTLSMSPASLLASGAAAGVAAGFNAPIAGIFFAAEVVRPTGENSLDLVTRLLAAALSAAVVKSFTSGDATLTQVQFDWVGGNVELLAFIFLGALTGVVSYMTRRWAGLAREGISTLSDNGVPKNLLPLVGSIFTICASLLCAGRVQFDGFGAFNEVLGDAALPMAEGTTQLSLDGLTADRITTPGEFGVFTAASLLALVFLKMTSTGVCQASGLVGGTFAPALYMGACLGGSLGRSLGAAVAGLGVVSSPSTYVVAGAASMLAANCSVPITSVVLAVELAGGSSYSATLPLICGIGIATYVSNIYLPGLFEGLDRGAALRRLEAAAEAI